MVDPENGDYTLQAGSPCIDVGAADIDGDGDMDIISASSTDDTIAWYENDGAANPTFSGAAIDYSTVNVLDGLERGGITVSANRHALDTERIFRFL